MEKPKSTSTVSPRTGASPLIPSDSQRPRLRSERVLACVLCQHRKVKCDRKFPCKNCRRFGKECTPATITPRRPSRRFPERDLLDRIHKYEDLLRKNKIEFDSLQTATGTEGGLPNSSLLGTDEESDNEQHDSSSAVASPNQSTEAKNLWSVLRQQWSQTSDNRDETIHDDVSQSKIRRAMDQLYVNNDHLLFGQRHTPVDLLALHPDPVQIFRLWQIYLTNVDPLLKVTHTPTLQGSIIEATSDLGNISSNFEALMFSIYSISVMSLSAEECHTSLGCSRDELLAKYQLACQKALLNSDYLRTNDRECLTAFYLFLVSIGPSTDPRSLSSMLGIAMRIACRIGIQSNATLANCSPFEAEMRRRLWWALKLIDSRIGELADSKTVALDPIWDCKIPLNVNDADLRTDMKELPSIQSPTSDAIFVVVRGALGDFIRHAKFHLDFTNPSLKSVSKESKKGLIPENWNMVSFEKFIEDKYLESCNLDSPLHLMTLWTTRIQLAKCHMLEHYWRYSDSPETQQDTQRDTMLHHALTILHCDANIMSSPLTRGYGWLLRFYFPFPAYVHVLQDLQRRPDCLQADKAWEVLSNHFEVRVNVPEGRNSPFFDLFTKIVLSAWEKREALFDSNQKAASAPSIVSIIKDREKERSQENRSTGNGQQPDSSYMNVDSLPTVAPVGIDDIPYSLGGHYFQPTVTFGMQPQYQIGMSTDRNPFPALDWTFGGATVW